MKHRDLNIPALRRRTGKGAHKGKDIRLERKRNREYLLTLCKSFIHEKLKPDTKAPTERPNLKEKRK